jgi:hypothetical protein
MKQALRPSIRLKVVIVAVSLLILCLVGVMAYAWFLENPIYPSFDPEHPTAAQQRAIDDALQWREGRVLSGFPVGTPAVDPKTGARYAFPDSVLPPGWVSEN